VKRHRPARPLVFALVRLAWGAALVAAPARIVVLLGGTDTPSSRAVERTLGTRHLIQAAVELAAWPSGRRLGVLVDTLHAATGVGLAAVDGRWRRPALLDAAITSAFALAGAAQR
jgi:hypothetical protein